MNNIEFPKKIIKKPGRKKKNLLTRKKKLFRKIDTRIVYEKSEKKNNLNKNLGGFPSFINNDKNIHFLEKLNEIYKIKNISKKCNYTTICLETFENVELVKINEKFVENYIKILTFLEKQENFEITKNSIECFENETKIEFFPYAEKKNDLFEFREISNKISGILFEISNKKNYNFEIKKIHITKKLLDIIMKDSYDSCAQSFLHDKLPKLFLNMTYEEVIDFINNQRENSENNIESDYYYLNSQESKLKKSKIILKEKYFWEKTNNNICHFLFLYFENDIEAEKVENNFENENEEDKSMLLEDIQNFYQMFYPEKQDFIENNVLKTNIGKRIGFRDKNAL